MDQNDRLLDYLQDRLSEEERIAFEKDISLDAELAAEVEVLRGAKVAMDPQDVPNKDEGWDRLSAAIDHETYKPANQNRPIRFFLMQTAASAVVAVVLWEALATPYLAPDSYFSPVSESASAPVLQIVFTDNATISDISALLKELDASIISGPGALGLYRVQLSDSENLEAVKNALEAQEQLVARVLTE